MHKSASWYLSYCHPLWLCGFRNKCWNKTTDMPEGKRRSARLYPWSPDCWGVGVKWPCFFFFLLFFLLMTKFRKNYKVPPAVFHVWTGPPIEPGPHGAQPASPQCWQQTRLTGHFTSFFKWHTRTYLENPPVTIFKILHPVPSWNNLVVLVHNFHGQSTMGCL